eukprot:CAMPEP_0114230552 /NCGR_PEP_ID=MMETSP0058-20121206/3535_1 /TAXON_ID=36894 /ORGANISM="Pyramimonas parkeae, CCMP726" /LENGTH=524 /DNA_ID=CAMNT_0001341769 /DNA_START=233 /DNA_END=1807 /DNA_ORIENTATION=+
MANTTEVSAEMGDGPDGSLPEATHRAPGTVEERPDSYHVDSQRHLLQPTDSNPLPTSVPPPIQALSGIMGERHVMVMLGLPCRGKSFTARRLQKYLQFFHGANCQRFDVCDYLSPEGGSEESFTDLYDDLQKFLTKDDAKAHTNMRYAVGELDDPRKKNVDSGRVAVLYASNSTRAFQETWSGSSKERRRMIGEQLEQLKEVRVKLIFVELMCTDERIVHSNLARKVQSLATNGEMDEQQLEAGILEWKKKILDYQRKYVTMQEDGSEDDLSYIKLINFGQKVITNNMHGYLPMRIVQFLSNIHTKPHSIYLSRHGQSEYNVLGKLGGNPPLTAYGRMYAQNLGKFAADVVCKESGETVPARLWTSSLQRTIETAAYIEHPVIGGWLQMANRVYRNLDEIFAGEYEGMTYAEIEKLQPDEASLRKMDKIGYRYPRGESYFDLIARLDPLVHELESYTEPVLVVSHQATLRVIYSYFMDIDRELAPRQAIPLHTVIKITYDGWMNCSEEHFYLGPDLSDHSGTRS